MTVSVVIPVHDAAGTVAETVGAVLAQTDPDWELILVDDASTDAGLEVALAAAGAAEDRVRTVASPTPDPTGPAASRNRGLAVARGDHVAFLDADDVWDPTFLARRLAVIGDAAMAWGPSRYWYPDRQDTPEVVQETGPAPGAHPISDWLWQLRWTPCPSAVVLRRDVVAELGGFPEELRRGEDVALWIAVATGHDTRYDPEPVVRYRRHPSSSTSRSAREGTTGSADLAFGRWAVAWVGGHDELAPLRPLAARSLHVLAHRVEGGPVHVRWVTTKTVLGTRGARHRWWAALLDWFLPLRTSRRVAARLDRVRVDP